MLLGHAQSLVKSLEDHHSRQSPEVCKEHAALLDWIVKVISAPAADAPKL